MRLIRSALALVAILASCVVVEAQSAYPVGRGIQITPGLSRPASSAGRRTLWVDNNNNLRFYNGASDLIYLTGSFYSTIQDEGTPRTLRPALNFIGSGISCVDNAGANRTDCTISGGGGGSIGNWTFTTNAADVSPAATMTIGGTTATGLTLGRAAYVTAITTGVSTPAIGPSSGQQHALPAVTSDTIALLAATQTLAAKTLTAPVINGLTSASGNINFGGSSGTFATPTGASTFGGSSNTFTNAITSNAGVNVTGSTTTTTVGSTGRVTISGTATSGGAAVLDVTNAGFSGHAAALPQPILKVGSGASTTTWTGGGSWTSSYGTLFSRPFTMAFGSATTVPINANVQMDGPAAAGTNATFGKSYNLYLRNGGGIYIQDSSTPTTSELFRVGNNAETTNFFSVTSSDVTTAVPVTINGASNYLQVTGGGESATLNTSGGLSVFKTVSASLVDGASLTSGTSASAGNQKWSPTISLTGNGWKTNATAASQSVSYRLTTVPIEGTAAPTGELRISESINGGGAVTKLQIGSSAITASVPVVPGFTTNVVAPAWIAVQGGVGFQNSFVNLGGAYSGTAYWKDALGNVWVYLAATGGTNGTTVFTLPAGYRPGRQFVFTSYVGTTAGYGIVATSGTVTPAGGSNAGAIGLFNFPAEQ